MTDDNTNGTAGASAGGGGNTGGTGNDGAASPQSRPEPQSDVLSLSQLIGGPIHALVDAEAQSAMATARFIRNVGFRQPPAGAPGDFGELQMARFTAKRQLEGGGEDTVEVQIPMLSLLPIPALQIRDAELDYVIKVIQTEAMPETQRRTVEIVGTEDHHPAIEPPATMRATFASEARGGNRRSMDMLVKMKVRIEQADMPAGLARLLNLTAEEISRVPVPPDVDRAQNAAIETNAASPASETASPDEPSRSD